MSSSITLRDRRDLPFFMVRLRALQEIRNNINGPRRARALGLYVLLCQIANEQRSDGEHVRLVATCRELAHRGALSTRTLKILSSALSAAGAAQFDTRIDPLRGAMPSLIHLRVQDGPWVALTVATANQLADRSRASLLPVLGLLAVLLELCDEQRPMLGGLCAETTRGNVARLVGCSTDTLDTWVKALESAEVLCVTRRRGSDGGHLPNLWEITEPSARAAMPTRHDEPALTENGKQPPGASKTARPRIENGLAENGRQPPGAAKTAAPGKGDTLAESGKRPRGKSASPVVPARPLNARAGSTAETPSTEEDPNPPTPLTGSKTGGDGDDNREDIVLCVELVRVLDQTRGPGPGRRYHADRDGWHAAARRVLVDHGLGKVLEVVAYLPCDQVVGTKVRSMPDLERHIEDLRHRAHAARALLPGVRGAVASGDVPGWPEAKALLMRVIQRHGAGGKAAALGELEARHPQLRRFTELVGWGALCQSPIEKQDYAYRTGWDDLTRRAATEEAA